MLKRIALNFLSKQTTCQASLIFFALLATNINPPPSLADISGQYEGDDISICHFWYQSMPEEKLRPYFTPEIACVTRKGSLFHVGKTYKRNSGSPFDDNYLQIEMELGGRIGGVGTITKTGSGIKQIQETNGWNQIEIYTCKSGYNGGYNCSSKVKKQVFDFYGKTPDKILEEIRVRERESVRESQKLQCRVHGDVQAVRERWRCHELDDFRRPSRYGWWKLENQ